MPDKRAGPDDETDYAELAVKYLALAQGADNLELRSTYLSLAAGYDQLARFNECMRISGLSREAAR